MTFEEQRKRFTVISNDSYKDKVKPKQEFHNSYQTNPLREQMVRFVNRDKKEKLSPADLLRW